MVSCPFGNIRLEFSGLISFEKSCCEFEELGRDCGGRAENLDAQTSWLSKRKQRRNQLAAAKSWVVFRRFSHPGLASGHCAAGIGTNHTDCASGLRPNPLPPVGLQTQVQAIFRCDAQGRNPRPARSRMKQLFCQTVPSAGDILEHDPSLGIAAATGIGKDAPSDRPA